MVKQRTKTRLPTIALILGCFFTIALIVCFMVGGVIYEQERPKAASYKEDLCRVRYTSFTTKGRYSCGRRDMSRRCYLPMWEVFYGQNGTKKAVIQGLPEGTYPAALSKMNEYKIESFYPCWYDTKKPSVAIWYNPTTAYGIILLICGAIFTVLAIIAFVVARSFRKQVDI